jgi:purine-binding chemotaxis protein CheW
MIETESISEWIQYLVFKSEDEEYGISIEKINCIIDNDLSITRVPTAPEDVLGVINLRGDIVPIVDFRKKLGSTSCDQNGKEKIIVIYTEDSSVGIMVDMVLDVIHIDRESMESSEPYTAHTHKEYFTAVAKYNQRLIIILDIDKFLSE